MKCIEIYLKELCQHLPRMRGGGTIESPCSKSDIFRLILQLFNDTFSTVYDI